MAILRNYLDKVNDLFIEIYLIGYNSAGESILFLIKSTNPQSKIIFSGVIDCYEEGEINKTIELINKFNIESLDFLCWTHPDEDHTLGIDKIFNQYTNKYTRIVIPQSLIELSNRLDSNTQTICEKIGQEVKKKKDTEMFDVVEAQAGLPLIELSIGSALRIQPYRFYIKCISPFYDLLLSQYDNNKLKNNHFSIALLMEFEGINLLFTSDIEKRTINRFYDNIRIPQRIHYIKIPHHGSEKSQILLNYFDYSGIEDKFNISCTTVYTKSNLPSFDVLREYKKRSKQLFCTNSKVVTKNDGVEGCGTFAVKFDIINKKFSAKSFGDAIEI